MGHSLARKAIVASLLVLGPPAHAAETLTLAHVVEVVRKQNPAVRGARAKAEAAAEVPARVRAYDDPVVSWEAWNVPESGPIDRADNNIFRLSQKIPFPGKRTLAAEMALRDAEVAGHDASASELDAVTAAKRAFAEYWKAHRLREVYRRDLTLTEAMSRLVAHRYATDDAVQADVVRAEVEVAHAAGELRMADLSIDGAQAALDAAMSQSPDDPLGMPEDPPAPDLPPSASSFVEQALHDRPELAARDADLAREHAALRLAEKGYLPDFELSVGRFVNHDAPNGFGAMASMTIPLAWKSKYDAGVAEASARITSAEADRRRAVDEVRRDVQQAYLRARTALVSHDLFGATHIPHAEEALRVTQSAYATGKADLTALVETMRNVERVHVEHLTAAAEFEEAYADLERAVGHELPRPMAATMESRHE